MAERYVGAESINHVAQPEGTELCFAACVVALSGEDDLDVVNMSLENAGVSEYDTNGKTGPLHNRTEVPILGSQRTLTIEPVQSPEEGAYETGGVIDLIAAKLAERVPVALMYKKTADMNDVDYHWILLQGYSEDETGVTAVNIMDPLASETQRIEPLEIVDMIERSMQFAGVFAYALSVE